MRAATLVDGPYARRVSPHLLTEYLALGWELQGPAEFPYLHIWWPAHVDLIPKLPDGE